MVIHICEKCGKNFNKKSTYNDHVNNKKIPCKPNNIIIIENPHNIPITPHNIPINPHEIPNNLIAKISKYICNFCERPFTRSDHLKRHLTDNCKVRKEETKDKEEIFQKLLDNAYRKERII